jgi:glycosyltransferase involved in cell wall biosynthesis
LTSTPNKVPLTVVILTYNEEINIRQALDNVVGWADSVFVLDSGSTDNTLSIIKEYPSVQVFYRKFDDYAKQRNYGIKELPHQNEWMLFLDADEFLMEPLKVEISQTLTNGNLEYDGFYLKRRFYFMGKWIRFGGYYPTIILRLFKHKYANCERAINEHIHVEGKLGKLKHDFVDSNNKDFTFWVDKHNKYSSYEADQVEQEYANISSFWGAQSERKQWIRENIWNKMLPPLLRPFIYFFYRYFLRLGFLDGKVGFIYHFMHGLVFLLMIDIKYIEQKMREKDKLK